MVWGGNCGSLVLNISSEATFDAKCYQQNAIVRGAYDG